MPTILTQRSHHRDEITPGQPLPPTGSPSQEIRLGQIPLTMHRERLLPLQPAVTGRHQARHGLDHVAFDAAQTERSQ